ncbi:MAG TPA: FtsX-like permease family protein [Candidatus Angelobacter sp.]|jgi:putative ABC transport system permease protein|nr:FtsX-like permease family protein [Candidatus Angelobacter sp.]
MKAYDLVELAGRNLREAILRNSLTTLGIGVGVASLVAMLSLGVGLQRLATRQLGRSGLFDSIFVSSGQGFRNGGRARSVLVPTTYKPLDDAARKTFQKIPAVVDVYPDIRVPSEFRFAVSGKPETSFFALMAGQPPSSRRSEAFDDLQGSFFSGPKVAETIILAEFGRELLDVPYDPKNADQKLTPEQAGQLLGKELTLRYRERQSIQSPTSDSQPADSTSFSVVTKEQKLKIVGIVATEPNGGTRGNARVLVPTDFADSLNMIMPGDLRAIIRPSEGKTYPSLVVRVTKSKEIAGIEAAIKKEGFSAFSIVDASKGIARFFTFLDLFLGIFGSLALAVASLGIVNTLVMAILERRREIGIMKAIGASDGDVKKLFFVEAGCMGALGGTLGVAMGWTIGKVINLGTNIYLRRQELNPENFWYVPWWLVVAALAFSVIVSLIAGLYPAARAARLDPVEALRQN